MPITPWAIAIILNLGCLVRTSQTQTRQRMQKPHRHRNITVKRLVLDAYQFFRAQSIVVKHLGRQFIPSREYIEIDVTYRCNLKCINCNRSCAQAPSNIEMPVSELENFLKQSIAQQVQWKRIRILGGEPTLHSHIYDIVDLFRDYQLKHNPSVRIVLGTNYFGNQVHQVLEKLPPSIEIKSTLKFSRVNLFKPFNVAPVDTNFNRYSDYTCGCRIIEDCGLGLTPSGYYMCAVAGGIDRIFQNHLGRKELPGPSDTLTDQMSAFCSLCGHFGFQWPTRSIRTSKTWRSAYRKYSAKTRKRSTMIKTR